MRIDIGIASYQNPGKLDATLKALRKNTKSDWRCFVVDNASPDPEVRAVIERHWTEEPRIKPVFLDENGGYASAVNYLLNNAETDYIAYLDNDAIPLTDAWDLKFAERLDHSPEVAMIFPVGHGAGGAYPIQRPGWTEILWGIGCNWMLRRTAMEQVGVFDDTLGHQEEVDYAIRLRMAGWKMCLATHVEVNHAATASRSPEAEARIGAGIKNWVNKWCKYFTGELVNYDSPNVLRFEDWPPTALYLEEFYMQTMPGLNTNPEHILIEGREYDLLRVPRAAYGGGTFYRGRII